MTTTNASKPGGALLPLATAALLALAGTLSAAPRFVMEIRDADGNISIPGEADIPGHPEGIEVVSFGKAYSPDHGFPAVDTTEMECGIVIDKALPKLLETLGQRAIIPKVDVYLIHDDAPLGHHEIAHMSVEHAQVVGLAPVIGEPNPLGFTQNAVAMLSLNFSRVTWTYSRLGPAEETSSTHVAYEDTEDPNFDDDQDGLHNAIDDDDDNDNVPDDYEKLNGTNALANDSAEDLDKDKQTNHDEWLAGTKANDPSSFFAISALSISQSPEGRTATVRFPVIADRHYRLLGTPNPALPRESWIEFDAFDTAPGSPDSDAEVVLNPAILPQLGRMLFTVEVRQSAP